MEGMDVSEDSEPQGDEQSRLSGLEREFEIHRIVPMPAPTVLERHAAALTVAGASLVGAGIGLVAILAAWYGSRMLY